jgi:ornithine cyclodeaminase/alanine dehydrogenase
MLQVMPAAVPEVGLMGLKAYTVTRRGARFVVLLFDAHSGAPAALIEADRMGQIRTGAASGVATRHLARPDARVVGCYGTGWQAATQLEAVCAVRAVRRIQVFGRDAERRRRFAEDTARRLGVEVVPVERPEDAAAGADILVTITASKTPVLRGVWIEPGAHINAAGSNALDRAELDVEAVRRAALIAVDSKAQAQLECGDLVEPIGQGLIRWEDVRELGEIIAGTAPGRPAPDAVTLFESQGLAMQDVAVGARVLERARRESVGREVDFGGANA